MSVQIVPLSPRPTVHYKDKTGNEVKAPALAFVWSDGHQHVTGWIVAKNPRFEGTTEQVDAGQVQRLEGV